MEHYTKLATLAFRVFGLIILSYTIPILCYGLVRIATGIAIASGTPDHSTFFGWVLYALAGLCLVILAKPLGRLAARGLDSSVSGAPSA